MVTCPEPKYRIPPARGRPKCIRPGEKKERRHVAVFTVFFCGTGSTRETNKKDFPAGEIVSTLADNHQGEEYVDWVICDGPGSGNQQDDELWTKPGGYWDWQGKGLGYGWDENVQHCINILKCNYERPAVKLTENQFKILKEAGVNIEGEEVGIFFTNIVPPARTTPTPSQLKVQKAKIMRKGAKPTAVNLIGWSRGGISCTMLAHAMAKDSALSAIPVNIFAVDPVPGLGNFQANRTTLPNNVKNYVAVYARNERTKGFAPVIPKPTGGAKVVIMPFPGRHATLPGNGAVDGEEGKQDAELLAPGKVVRHLAETHLTAWGTKLGNMLNLSKPQIIALYWEMLKADEKYEKMQEKTYSPLPAEDNEGERSVSLGTDWTGFSSVHGGAYGKGLTSPMFVSWHQLAQLTS
jgi:hypothetical protein